MAKLCYRGACRTGTKRHSYPLGSSVGPVCSCPGTAPIRPPAKPAFYSRAPRDRRMCATSRRL
eukprot:4565298-Prymnesium_polylepis.1